MIVSFTAIVYFLYSDNKEKIEDVKNYFNDIGFDKDQQHRLKLNKNKKIKDIEKNLGIEINLKG